MKYNDLVSFLIHGFGVIVIRILLWSIIIKIFTRANSCTLYHSMSSNNQTRSEFLKYLLFLLLVLAVIQTQT